MIILMIVALIAACLLEAMLYIKYYDCAFVHIKTFLTVCLIIPIIASTAIELGKKDGIKNGMNEGVKEYINNEITFDTISISQQGKLVEIEIKQK